MFSEERAWPWPDLDARMTAALVAPYLGHDFPLVFLDEGDFCLAFLSGSQVVRVARHQRAADALKREACFLSKVQEQLPLPVPHPRFVEHEHCPPFSIHEQIVGELLTGERWEQLSFDRRRRAVHDLAGFLQALHAIPPTVAMQCGVTQLDAAPFAADLRTLAPGVLYGRLPPHARLQLDELLERWASASPQTLRSPAPLHGDLASGHLFFDPVSGGLTGVIDFGDLALGDPARDFLRIEEEFGPVILNEVLIAYAGQDAMSLLPEIRKWSLLEKVSWCLDLAAEHREGELVLCLDAIELALAARVVE